MNSLRNLVCILMGLVVAAFALPSSGAPQFTKQYNLTLTSSASTPLTVVADLTNKALGPGNSNIGSFQLTFSGATIASVTTNPAIPPGTITVNGSTVFVTGIAPLKAGKTFELTIVLNDCGDGISLPQSGVQVWTGNMGQTFTPINSFPLTASVSCTVLDCGDPTFQVPDSQNLGTVTVTRDFWDKNGDTAGDFCAQVPITVTNTVTSDGKVHFEWPLDLLTGDPAAAFEVKVNNGGTSLTLVAWLNKDGTPVTSDPDFITGQDCLVPKVLPAPYGTLDAAIIATDTSITIDGVAADPLTGNALVPPTPFPVVIIDSNDATKTERLTATLLTLQVPVPQPPGYAGTYALTYNVTRGTATEGDPLNANKAPHAAGALVMSTPLPIMGASDQGVNNEYKANTQAQMCIAEQGLNFTRFFDIGDGWGGHP